jgi:hypothetical protein
MQAQRWRGKKAGALAQAAAPVHLQAIPSSARVAPQQSPILSMDACHDDAWRQPKQERRPAQAWKESTEDLRSNLDRKGHSGAARINELERGKRGRGCIGPSSLRGRGPRGARSVCGGTWTRRMPSVCLIYSAWRPRDGRKEYLVSGPQGPVRPPSGGRIHEGMCRGVAAKKRTAAR